MQLTQADTPAKATPPVQEWLKITILFAMGIYMAYLIYMGKLSYYINERFVWLSYTAVGLLLLLAAAAAYRLIRPAQMDYAFYDPNATKITWPVLGVVAIPLILGTMVPASPLGVEAINGGVNMTAVRGVNETNFVIAPENRNILDWLRMFGGATDYDSFNGQPVNLSGFVYREPGYNPEQFTVARFTVSCCVADSSAIGLPVVFSDAGTLQDGQWVQVEGQMQAEEFNGEIVPVIQAGTITPIEQPPHPYLYP